MPSAPPTRAIVFDIETRIDWSYVRDRERLQALEASYEPPESYRDPLKIAINHTEWWFKKRKQWTFSPLTATVVAIAWADLWEGDVECIASDDEVEVLCWFADALGEKEAVLTGYNVRKFDVPFVTTRASVQEVAMPWWWPHERDYRRIADVFDVTGGGRCDQWLEQCGLPQKTADGASVEFMTLDQVHAYCENDVRVERLLAQRFAANMAALRSTQRQQDYQELPTL